MLTTSTHKILKVQNRCDTNAWSIGASGGRVNLLHRAISSIDEEAGCFLVRSGCDMNTQCILPSKDGKGISSPPIHLACKASMDKLLQSLFEHGVDVNTQVLVCVFE